MKQFSDVSDTMRNLPGLSPYIAGTVASDPDVSDRLCLGESAYGASPRAIEAIRAEAASVHLYPDGNMSTLRAALADHYGTVPSRIAIANGIDELILLAALSLAEPGDLGIFTERTFFGYEASLRVARCALEPVPLKSYSLDVNAILDALDCGPAIAFLCNPHNPTGSALSQEAVAAIVELAERRNVWLVFDEAYAEYAPPARFGSAIHHALAGERVLVLRTFSKAYGLAGARCGYAIGPDKLISALLKVRNALPFNANRFALAAARAALIDQAHLRRVIKANEVIRSVTVRELRALGLTVPDSTTNFVLVGGCSREPQLAALLAAAGVLTRDATPFGFPEHVRITLGRSRRMECVVGLIRELLDRATSEARSGVRIVDTESHDIRSDYRLDDDEISAASVQLAFQRRLQ